MHITRHLLRPVSLFVVLVMTMVAGPVQTAAAAMIDTQAAIDSQRIQETRDTLLQLIAREDIQQALMEKGIQPHEAKQRIDSLTDRELARIADELDRLPAGAGFLEFVGFVVVVGFIVLLITDMLGFTDVFPFINPADKRSA